MAQFTKSTKLELLYERLANRKETDRDMTKAENHLTRSCRTIGGSFLPYAGNRNVTQIIVETQNLSGHWFMIDDMQYNAWLFRGLSEVVISNKLLREWCRRTGVPLKKKT